jgi:hypothetical protein
MRTLNYKALTLKGLAALALWAEWKHTANLSVCWLFWLMVLAFEFTFMVREKWLAPLLLITGTASNGLVTMLNNGVMPVVGMGTIIPANPIWHEAMTGSRLLVLADHASLWYFSIGDLLLQASLLVLVAQFIQSKRGKHAQNAVAVR